MDQQRNILFGKLAIGRRLLTREQASEGFRAISSALRAGGGQRNLWDFCRDKGYLRDEQIALVMRVIDNGMWVCTKGCEGGTALMDFPADRPFVCPGCSAPLQIVPRTPSKSSAGSTGPGGMVKPAMPKTSVTDRLKRRKLAERQAAEELGSQPVPVGQGGAAEPDTVNTSETAELPPGEVARARAESGSGSDVRESPVGASPAHAEPSNSLAGEGASARPLTDSDAPPALRPAASVRPDSDSGFVPSGGAGSLAADAGGAGGAIARSRGTALKSGRARFAPGQVVGDYEILSELGRGGMGMVLKARQRSTGRDAALKVLLEKAESNPKITERFNREVKVGAKLRHPAIVGVYDAGFTDGHHWMAMEYVDGRDMQAWRGEPGRSIGQGIQLLIKVCEGVEFAHSRFIVHRDLKPGNVMVTREGDQPKICDFGLAKALAERSSLTKTGDILGTPYYMAPEQAMGKHLLIGPPTDVWALGVMLYEMATGRLPFQGKTTFKIIRGIATETAPSPSSLGFALPPDFEKIIMTCLEKEPARRYRSAGKLGGELTALFG